MRAVWNGQTVAESDQTVVVEGNHYFPVDSVVDGVLKPSDKTTVCGWKGTASYFDLEVEGQTNPDSVFQYLTPKSAAAEIDGHVAFWKGVTVTD